MAQYDGDRGISSGGLITAFLAGAALGAVAALLLAPQSGEESREQLRRYARRTQDNLREMAEKAGQTWESAMEAGREAMRRERDSGSGGQQGA